MIKELADLWAYLDTPDVGHEVEYHVFVSSDEYPERGWTHLEGFDAANPRLVRPGVEKLRSLGQNVQVVKSTKVTTLERVDL